MYKSFVKQRSAVNVALSTILLIISLAIIWFLLDFYKNMTQITRSEAIDMLTNAPLIDVLSAGFKEKNSRFGSSITYANNLQINPTNLCIYSCRFCDFAAKPNSQHAYMLDTSEILNSIGKLPDLDEVHIVGGLWPKWGFSQALELVTNIRSRHPRIWIKAFTAVEMAYFAHQERKPVSEVIDQLRAAPA